MVTAIFCNDCGTTIPHTEPGLTEHIGHRIEVVRNPSPIPLNAEYRDRIDIDRPDPTWEPRPVIYSEVQESDLYAESMEEREARRQARRVGIPSAFKPWVTPAGPSPRGLMSDGLDMVRRITGRKAGRWTDLPEPWIQLPFDRSPSTRWDRL